MTPGNERIERSYQIGLEKKEIRLVTLVSSRGVHGLHVRKRSDLRFDLDASGFCSMPGLPYNERRFDCNASTDLSLPIYLSGAEEGDNQRFDRFERVNLI